MVLQGVQVWEREGWKVESQFRLAGKIHIHQRDGAFVQVENLCLEIPQTEQSAVFSSFFFFDYFNYDLVMMA